MNKEIKKMFAMLAEANKNVPPKTLVERMIAEEADRARQANKIKYNL